MPGTCTNNNNCHVSFWCSQLCALSTCAFKFSLQQIKLAKHLHCQLLHNHRTMFVIFAYISSRIDVNSTLYKLLLHVITTHFFSKPERISTVVGILKSCLFSVTCFTRVTNKIVIKITPLIARHFSLECLVGNKCKYSLIKARGQLRLFDCINATCSLSITIFHLSLFWFYGKLFHDITIHQKMSDISEKKEEFSDKNWIFFNFTCNGRCGGPPILWWYMTSCFNCCDICAWLLWCFPISTSASARLKIPSFRPENMSPWNELSQILK